MCSEEKIKSWHNQLDKIRVMFENAQEEYESYLREFEDDCGEQEREKYEEAHV